MKRRAMCEIFGAYGWAEGTRIMKYLADHMLVRGINYFVPHAFSPKLNDPDCPPNFYATGNNPQYKYFGRLMGYMNRVCHLLEGSIHRNTCAILYDAENEWNGREHLSIDQVAKTLYDHQLDFDILPPEALDDMDENGDINGEHYGLLLVPACAYIRPAVRERLKALFRQSAIHIMVVTESPEHGAPASDKDFMTAPLCDVAHLVRDMGFGDVESHEETRFLRYHHTVRGGAHIYLFTNEDITRTIDTDVTLRDFSGGTYVLYDPFENRAEVISADLVHLTLPPYGSVMILCGDVDTVGLPLAPATACTTTRPLTPTFSISLCERDGDEFVFYRTMTDLVSLTGRGECPRFSGTARYTATVNLTAADTVLDLGDVGETAEVFLNGHPLGVRLFPPYRFDLSGVEHNGVCELSVLVTNTLGHRIHDGFSKFLMLPPCGILGPVTVESH